MTPSWSSLTRGSADKDFLCPEMGLGLDMGLEDIWSEDDGIFSLGLGVPAGVSDADDGLGVSDKLGLPVGSLEMGLGISPEPRPDLL